MRRKNFIEGFPLGVASFATGRPLPCGRGSEKVEGEVNSQADDKGVLGAGGEPGSASEERDPGEQLKFFVAELLI